MHRKSFYWELGLAASNIEDNFKTFVKMQLFSEFMGKEKTNHPEMNATEISP